MRVVIWNDCVNPKEAFEYVMMKCGKVLRYICQTPHNTNTSAWPSVLHTVRVPDAMLGATSVCNTALARAHNDISTLGHRARLEIEYQASAASLHCSAACQLQVAMAVAAIG
jgi:hypothetical protein